MPTLPASHSSLSEHTFGRDHMSPPPLPSSIKQLPVLEASPVGDALSVTKPAHAAGLVHDLDHIVRSVGEW